MSYCQQCLCCEAQPGFTQCIFCEDGVPCPYAKQKTPAGTSGASTSKSQTPQKNALAWELRRPGRVGVESAGTSLHTGTGTAKQNAVTVGKDRQPPPPTNGNGHAHQTDPAQDTITALVAQGYKVRKVNAAVTGVYQPGDSFDTIFKKALDLLSGRTVTSGSSVGRSRGNAPRGGASDMALSAPHVKPSPEPRKESRHMQEKIPCAAPKYGKPVCPKMVTKNSKTGLCGGHFYLTRMVDPKAAKRPPKTKTKAARTAELVHPELIEITDQIAAGEPLPRFYVTDSTGRVFVPKDPQHRTITLPPDFKVWIWRRPANQRPQQRTCSAGKPSRKSDHRRQDLRASSRPPVDRNVGEGESRAHVPGGQPCVS